MYFRGAFHAETGETGEENNLAFSSHNAVCEANLQVSANTFISHIKMSIFFRKGRSSNYILESQPGKPMLEPSREITTEPIAVLTKIGSQ